MRIQKELSCHRNDFTAVMECEHCGHEQKLTSGYHDSFYHNHVIPAMTCGGCGKNRSGEVPAEKNDNGFGHVPAVPA
jgi:transcription elongation factor Elf1